MRFKKIEKGIENIFSGDESILSKTLKRIKDLFNDVVDHILFFLRSPVIIIVTVAMIILCVGIHVAGLVLLNKYFHENDLTCLGDFDIEGNQSLKSVNAVPDGYAVKNSYVFGSTTQKSDYKDFGIKSNHDYKKINITGVWIPWFGDEIIIEGNSNTKNRNRLYIDIDTPDRKFICNMNKGKFGNNKYVFGKTDMENEFYYIKNYYSNVEVLNNKGDINYTTLNANEQQQCWLNRGMGLYMGFFGRDGKSQPQHFHHLLADKAVCETPYFIPDKSFIDALLIAKSSGVDINLVIPGVPDKKTVYHVTYSYLEELLKAGINVYLYPGFIHSKMVVCDDRVASIGTANLDVRSFSMNFEVTALMFGKKEVIETIQIAVNDISKSHKLTYLEYKNRPKKDKIQEHLFRLCAPLM